jgi:hypothetical protein
MVSLEFGLAKRNYQPMPPPIPLPDVPSDVTVLLMVNVLTDVPLLHVPPSYQPFQLFVLSVRLPPVEIV